MEIKQIEIYQSRIKLIDPFVISLGMLTHAENVIVLVKTESGIIGYGECSPFKTIHGESMLTCFEVAKLLAEVLLGKDPCDIESCHKWMDLCIYGNTSIKSAFDIALYDIASQHAGLPLYQYLGGKKSKALFTDYTVSIGEPERMALDALKIVKNGFPVVKVKLGGEMELDIERISSIRKAIGDRIPIRIDANQGWDFETAQTILPLLEAYDIQHCEEPIARWDYMRLPLIRIASRIPIMADETCCDHHDAERLIQINACDQFNIKLGKSSGIYKALKIIAMAERANIKLQVGGFLESRLGFTASAHLALCSDQIVYCDFDTPMMFVEDPIVGGIVYGKNGLVEVPDGIGLGASFDEAYLGDLEGKVVRG